MRMIDGGHPVARARVTIDLLGHLPDSDSIKGLESLTRKTLTIDLFEPPQRERIREQVVQLRRSGKKEREIPPLIVGETPTITAIQRSMALQRMMEAKGLTSPWVVLLEPPLDYTKLRRHRHKRYRFTPVEGYVPRPLN